MSFKTILVHVDESSRSEVRVNLAAEIAKANDAHLIGTAVTGISRYLYLDTNIGAGDPNLLIHLDFLKQRADRSLDAFRQKVESLGVLSSESVVANDEAAGGIGLQARYSDLVIIGQTNPDDFSSTVQADFPESIIVNSGRPVLVVPFAGEVNAFPRRPVIGWDTSREASRAITDALPILKNAEVVHVAVLNPDAFPYAHGEEPGADIALYLARHGVKVEVTSRKVSGDVGDALLAFANEVGSDLLVLGGYGHSRFREMILGGVTKTVLEKSTIPVLMSH